VRLDEDLVLLRMDGGTFRILPVVALTSGQSAPDAVATINTWINEASHRGDGHEPVDGHLESPSTQADSPDLHE